MQNNSKFYKLLKEAVTSDVALVKVLDQIMKIINYNPEFDS